MLYLLSLYCFALLLIPAVEGRKVKIRGGGGGVPEWIREGHEEGNAKRSFVRVLAPRGDKKTKGDKTCDPAKIKEYSSCSQFPHTLAAKTKLKLETDTILTDFDTTTSPCTPDAMFIIDGDDAGLDCQGHKIVGGAGSTAAVH